MYILPPAGQLASKLQGDRIETPTWIREKGLEIDAKYYMEHQLMNPLSQLFALIVEELPGCKNPTGKPWSAATDADRELAAIDFLFGESLKTCDKAAEKRLAERLFGSAVTVKHTVASAIAHRTRSSVAPPMAKIQGKLGSLFAQQMIQNAMNPPKKKVEEPEAPPKPPVKKAARKKAAPKPADT
jgi:hypothetical protein